MILGYPTKDRSSLYTPEGEQDAELDVVYYEKKGTNDAPYWKLFLWTGYGQYFEATGITIDKAVDTLKLNLENYTQEYLGNF
mgnify:CR=1 FL=1